MSVSTATKQNPIVQFEKTLKNYTKEVKDGNITEEEFINKYTQLFNQNKQIILDYMNENNYPFHPGIFTRFNTIFDVYIKEYKSLSVENYKKLYREFYTFLFPLQQSYEAIPLLENIKRDVNALKSEKSDEGYNLAELLRERLEHYLQILDIETFQHLTYDEKKDYLIKLNDVFKFLPKNLELKLYTLLGASQKQIEKSSIIIPSHADKLNSLPDDIPIYYYGGHGRDLCDTQTNTPLTAIVPDDCIYITTGICGYTTEFNQSLIDLFREKSEHSRILLRYPYLFEHIIELAERFDIPIENFHIHLPGTQYVVSLFSSVLTWDNVGHFSVSLGGLCEKKDMELLDSNLYTYDLHKAILSKIVSIFQEPVKTDTILSTLKTFDVDLLNIYTFLAKDLTNDKKTYKKLMESPLTENYWKSIAQTNETLTIKELKDILHEFFFTIPLKDFLSYYDASTIPTKEEIHTILDDIENVQAKNLRLDGSIFQELSKRIMKNNSLMKLTTKNMMEKYPGIHYFTVCRSVTPECEHGASLRRTMSGEQQTKRIEDLVEKLPSQQLYIDIMNINIMTDLPEFINTHRAQLETQIHSRKVKDFILNRFIKEYYSKLSVPMFTYDDIFERISHFNTLYELLFPTEKKSYTLEEAIHQLTEEYNHISSIIQPLFDVTTRNNIYQQVIKRNKIEKIIENIDINSIQKEDIERIKKENNQEFNRFLFLMPKNNELYKLLSASAGGKRKKKTRKIHRKKSSKKTRKQ